GGGEMGEMVKQAREAQEAKIKARLHLDKPWVVAYGMWLWDTVHGDFGDSIQYNTPVRELIAERLPVTLTMQLIATFIVYMVALPGGMLAVVKRGRSFDVGWSFVTLAL